MKKEKIYTYYYVSTSGTGGGLIESTIKVPIGGIFEYNGTEYKVTGELDGFNFYAEIL